MSSKRCGHSHIRSSVNDKIHGQEAPWSLRTEAWIKASQLSGHVKWTVTQLKEEVDPAGTSPEDIVQSATGQTQEDFPGTCTTSLAYDM